MWDSLPYAHYATQERMRDLASEAQHVSLERNLQPPRPRGLWRRLVRGLLSLGPRRDPELSDPASPSSQPPPAPRELKTEGARARARLRMQQWRKEVMRLALTIGLARYLS